MTPSPLSKQIERRIFIVGVPRSGTTLVQSLLAAHSELTSFTESHFFDRYFTLFPGATMPILVRNPTSRVQEFLGENDEDPTEAAGWLQDRWPLAVKPFLPLQTRSVGRKLLGVLDELALRRGQSGWVEKTPRHLRYIPFLKRLVDTTSSTCSRVDFVHVIRKGLEVVASLHKASQHWERSYDVTTCVDRWNADVHFSLRRAGNLTDHFVFYEELTARPEETLRQLLSQLGLEWEPEILQRQGDESQGLVTRDETWKAGIDRSIRPSATSQQSLTEEQRARALRSLRHEHYEELVERVLAQG
ncbi:MAG: sulfotransferase [Deltaproteobacteria bacterium]|nr:sulfotransferase [Deltaproteobacteria bacterium]